MITREDILGKAADECLKELYSFVQPKVEWNDFVEENKEYSKKYRVWERFTHLKHKENLTEEESKEFSTFPVEWKDKSIKECIGPRPYEFYYIPRDIMKDLCDSYVDAYKIDSQQELLDIIKTLKEYCEKPIVDKYVEDWTDENGLHHPGHRSYDHPKNLKEQIVEILGDVAIDNEYYQNRICDKFYEFLDMAGNFYNWNRDLNSFNITVYLGPSPNSNKEAVIENWKKYKGVDIKIDEEQIKKEYYGEEDF